jgi:hypothetical protein
MDAAAQDLSKRLGEFDSILKGRGRLAQRFAEHQNHTARACNALLTIYREANRKARRAPAPEYFSKPYEMERIVYEGDDKEGTTRKKLEQSILESQTLLEGQVAAIYEAFEKAAKSYREIDDLIPEEKRGPAQP